VPRALQLALVHPDLPFGQREVLVAAPVTDGVEVVADPYEGDADRPDVETAGLPRLELVLPA
jgi:hypothetical protein